MPQFRYRAVTQAGEIVVGEVDASSREEMVRRTEYLGHLTIDAEIAATGLLSRGHRSIGKLPRSRDVSIFLRQLSLLHPSIIDPTCVAMVRVGEASELRWRIAAEPVLAAAPGAPDQPRWLPYRVSASVAWGSNQVITAETIRLGRPEP
jgi:hypothetical protein